VPTATTSTRQPHCDSKAGRISLNRPVSTVLVVVASFSTAGAEPACGRGAAVDTAGGSKSGMQHDRAAATRVIDTGISFNLKS
jgi:hypothetical protein